MLMPSKYKSMMIALAAMLLVAASSAHAQATATPRGGHLQRP